MADLEAMVVQGRAQRAVAPEPNAETLRPYGESMATVMTAEQFAIDVSTVDEMIQAVEEYASQVQTGQVGRPDWPTPSGIKVDMSRFSQWLRDLDKAVKEENILAMQRCYKEIPTAFFSRLIVLRILDAAGRGDKDKEYARKHLLLSALPSMYEYFVLAFPERFLAQHQSEGNVVQKCQVLRDIMDRISKQMMDLGLSDELPIFREGEPTDSQSVRAKTLVSQLDEVISRLQSGKSLEKIIIQMRKEDVLSYLLKEPLTYILKTQESRSAKVIRTIKRVFKKS